MHSEESDDVVWRLPDCCVNEPHPRSRLYWCTVRLRTASPTDNFERGRQIGFQSLQSSWAILRAECFGGHGFAYQRAERHRGQGVRTIAFRISSYPALWRYLQRQSRSREYGIFYGPPR